MRYARYIPVVMLLCTFIFSSCEKEIEETENQFTVPEDREFDVDGDGTTDYELRYAQYAWDALDDSGYGWIGSVLRTNPNNFLLNDELNFNALLQEGDTIRQQNTDRYKWTSIASLLGISNAVSENLVWPDMWTARGLEAHSVGFLCIKMTDFNGVERLGWIKLMLNLEDGTVAILDVETTTEDMFVIGN